VKPGAVLVLMINGISLIPLKRRRGFRRHPVHQ
jgi:hypothetical protein